MTHPRRLALATGAALACLVAVAPGIPAQQALPPLDLSFLPPDYAPRDICNASSTEPPPARPTAGTGDGVTLTNEERVRFLNRDIARLMREDAAAHFDFITDLIDRVAKLDPEFDETQAAFERIRLYMRAGRMDALRESGLVAALLEQSDTLGPGQLMTLSQFLRNGIGILPDPRRADALILEAAYGGQTLILEAAFGGHARALLEIVRLDRLGTPVKGWDAPMDLTVTMAFGGLLGGMTPGLCARAEVIAREYLTGEIVRRDPETAHAWRRFAADMGGAEAAWRVVEYHLNAPSDRKDDAELRRYLQRAIDLGIVPDAGDRSQLAASGALTAEELQAMLGANSGEENGRTSDALIPLLELDVNPDGSHAGLDGLYLDYLRELSQMPGAPGKIFTRLADEVSVKKGRWAAEAEILALLEEAVRRGDPDGMQELAARLIRYRHDPAKRDRAENLLLETVSRFGLPGAMDQLDTLNRCQVADAPRLSEAYHWAEAYRATGHAPVQISGTDLITLDPFKHPETLARIQSDALRGRSSAVALMVERMMSDGLAIDDVLRHWADRLDNSALALEAFAELEFELSTSPRQRAQAVEFFRRVYLNNGATTALDLAIALIEDNARDPDVAQEIVDLLTSAGHRGEGASIRLLARLQADERDAREVYAEFAEDIEARGDFLALMFAMPYLTDEKAGDYFDRAVSVMKCGTKDAEELGDAYAIRGDAEMSFHWRRVGLHFEGGHTLSRLSLTGNQMAMFDRGAAPDVIDVAERNAGERVPLALRQAFWLAANPDLASYDPQAAAAHLMQAFDRSTDRDWAVGAWRRTGPAIREIVAETHDIRAISLAAAEAGSSRARFEHAMLLRDRARGPADLADSLIWLRRAADAGHKDAMVELGFALAFGLGTDSDDTAALHWLDRASAANNDRAVALAALIRSRATP